MNRIIALFLSVAFFLAGACTKQDALSNAEDVLNSLKGAAPLITQILPAVGPQVNLDIDEAAKLVADIQANLTDGAVKLLDSLIPTFEEIVNKTSLIADVNTRTEILAILAVADIALNYLAVHLKKAAATTQGIIATRLSGNVDRFASAPVWGLKFKTKK
jgi:hypothetical protein